MQNSHYAQIIPTVAIAWKHFSPKINCMSEQSAQRNMIHSGIIMDVQME